jgi:hypothetical protein
VLSPRRSRYGLVELASRLRSPALLRGGTSKVVSWSDLAGQHTLLRTSSSATTSMTASAFRSPARRLRPRSPEMSNGRSRPARAARSTPPTASARFSPGSARAPADCLRRGLLPTVRIRPESRRSPRRLGGPRPADGDDDAPASNVLPSRHRTVVRPGRASPRPRASRRRCATRPGRRTTRNRPPHRADRNTTRPRLRRSLPPGAAIEKPRGSVRNGPTLRPGPPLPRAATPPGSLIVVGPAVRTSKPPRTARRRTVLPVRRRTPGPRLFPRRRLSGNPAGRVRLDLPEDVSRGEQGTRGAYIERCTRPVNSGRQADAPPGSASITLSA